MRRPGIRIGMTMTMGMGMGMTMVMLTIKSPIKDTAITTATITRPLRQ